MDYFRTKERGFALLISFIAIWAACFGVGAGLGYLYLWIRSLYPSGGLEIFGQAAIFAMVGGFVGPFVAWFVLIERSANAPRP